MMADLLRGHSDPYGIERHTVELDNAALDDMRIDCAADCDGPEPHIHGEYWQE